MYWLPWMFLIEIHCVKLIRQVKLIWGSYITLGVYVTKVDWQVWFTLLRLSAISSCVYRMAFKCLALKNNLTPGLSKNETWEHLL